MRLEPLFDQEIEQIKREYEEQILQERRSFERRFQEIEQQIQERQAFERRIQEQIEQDRRADRQRIQQERRASMEATLKLRFGSIDEELAAIIEPAIALPSEEYAALIAQLPEISREELLARFRR